MSWQLKRTKQCAKCPWRRDVDPTTIPNGYCETKHRNLENTIAKEDGLAQLDGLLHVMACHETENAHCLGWLMNQLGPGNNIQMRIQVLSCSNIGKVKLVGEQHECFKDTLQKDE